MKNGSKTQNGSFERPKVKRVRGWFPRKTAIEFFEENQSSSDDESSDDQKKNK